MLPVTTDTTPKGSDGAANGQPRRPIKTMPVSKLAMSLSLMSHGTSENRPMTIGMAIRNATILNINSQDNSTT
jgi:hypothetical protein